ncbi:hypothetical protein [Kitasatospora aureofaciens]|uniref:hypothetical protein n=1 Tax=Kitasatospora aureofaciens TaxID=1894 RepID=UPI0038200FC1
MTLETTWRLMRGDELLGEIVVEEADFPWQSGRFIPQQGFAGVKPWFDESTALVDAEDYEAFDRSYDRIEESLTLVAPDGPVDGFLLHVWDDRASFRC